jgi:hypothetical protein
MNRLARCNIPENNRGGRLMQGGTGNPRAANNRRTRSRNSVKRVARSGPAHRCSLLEKEVGLGCLRQPNLPGFFYELP